MKSARKILTVAAVGVVLAGTSTGWAIAASHSPSNPNRSANGQAQAPRTVSPIDTSTESKFTPIVPCRIVDTRSGGGPITSGFTRSFGVTGTTSFAAQGGNSSGCGVPTAATAVAVTVIAVNQAGTGYLKLYPYGAPVPLSSFLNFSGTAAVSTGGTAPITGGGAPNLTVKAFTTTNVIIDVQGYYITPLFAYVNTDATLGVHSRTTGSSKVATGQYEVDFDRDVSHCSYAIGPDTVGYHNASVVVEPRGMAPNGVFVAFVDTTNAFVDEPFYLTVTC